MTAHNTWSFVAYVLWLYHLRHCSTIYSRLICCSDGGQTNSKSSSHKEGTQTYGCVPKLRMVIYGTVPRYTLHVYAVATVVKQVRSRRHEKCDTTYECKPKLRISVFYDRSPIYLKSRALRPVVIHSLCFCFTIYPRSTMMWYIDSCWFQSVETKNGMIYIVYIYKIPLRSGAQTRGVMQEKTRIVTEKLHGWAQFVR